MIIDIRQLFPNNILEHRFIDISDGWYDVVHKAHDKIYVENKKLLTYQTDLVIFTFVYDENMSIYRQIIGDSEVELFIDKNGYSEKWIEKKEQYDKQYNDMIAKSL